MIIPAKLNKFAFFLFYYGILLLAISIPLSKFTMSISQFMIAVGWLLCGNLKARFSSLRNSPAALLLIGLFLLHVFGLVYTTDFQYAFKDLRIKLPLLVLPLIMATAPLLSKNNFRVILITIVAGTAISTFISYSVYKGWIHREVNDIRDISIFISHIRLVLMCCISIFIITWFLFIDKVHSWIVKFTGGAIVLWFLYFIILLQSATGIFILAFAFSGITLFALYKSKNVLLKIFPALFILSGLTYAYIKFTKVQELFVIKEPVSQVNLNAKTPSGNIYYFYSDEEDYENGYPVWAYICEPELEKEWSKRSNLPYMGKDERNQVLRFTLMRYLASKGLHKDSAGVSLLNEGDIAAIERGVANYVYLEGGSLEARMHQVIWELNSYHKGFNPSGHSVAQRFEYWKAAKGIICKFPWLGVGTGDVPNAFEKQYNDMNSVLKPEWRLRAHNQYLSIAVAFGLCGLIYFLFMCFYLLIKGIQRIDYLYVTFAFSAILSMITEDTLETQAGITYFTFFSCLFLFVNPQNSSIRGIGDSNTVEGD